MTGLLFYKNESGLRIIIILSHHSHGNINKEYNVKERKAELFSLPVKVESVEIPYERTTLPGYLHKVDDYYDDDSTDGLSNNKDIKIVFLWQEEV